MQIHSVDQQSGREMHISDGIGVSSEIRQDSHYLSASYICVLVRYQLKVVLIP
jgi:hypothetical protein